MIYKNKFSLFVTTILIIGFFFLALPEEGYSGVSLPPNNPLPDPGPDPGPLPDPGPEAINVPTLSEWGLIAMAGILGIVGFMVIRSRKATA